MAFDVETYNSYQYLEYDSWYNECAADSVKAKSFLTNNVTLYKPQKESRPKPDPEDLIWNPVAHAFPGYEKTWAAITPLVNIAASHDYACSPVAYWGRQRYYRYVTYKLWEQDPSLELEWPAWSTPIRLKVKDEVINLGATLAEYRQSVSMFGSAARGVVDAFRAFKQKKFLKNRSMCSISAAHLIHDYGVAPLVSDMYDSYEALRLRLERPVYRRYHLRQKCADKHLTKSGSLGTYGTFETRSVRKGTQYTTAHVELDMSEASMFTLGNPLEVAWELVPYSFVVDWFIPIGDTLIALDALKNVKRIKVCVSKKHRQKDHTYTEIKDRHGNWYPCESTGGCDRAFGQREVYDSVPLPSMPKFSLEKAASIPKLLNALSLLVSARGCKGVMPRFTKRDFGLS